MKLLKTPNVPISKYYKKISAHWKISLMEGHIFKLTIQYWNKSKKACFTFRNWISSSNISRALPMKWVQIFTNDHLQPDNFCHIMLRRRWLVLAEQQLTENLTVKFSVMMAFRYHERYQVTCKTAKNSNVTIFFTWNQMRSWLR